MLQQSGGSRSKNLKDLVLLKKDIPRDVRAVKEMRRGRSDQHVILCKVRSVGA